PRFTGDEDDRRPLVAHHPPPLRAEESQLVVAPDERRLLDRRRLAFAQAEYLEDRNRIALALEDHGLTVTEGDAAGSQLGRAWPDEHLAASRRLLEAGGHVHGVADHGDVAVAPDGRGHHLAAVDAAGEGQIAAEPTHPPS